MYVQSLTTATGNSCPGCDAFVSQKPGREQVKLFVLLCLLIMTALFVGALESVSAGRLKLKIEI